MGSRLLAGVLFVSSLFFATVAKAEIQTNPQNATSLMLLEQLIHHIADLQSEVNLTQAAGFRLQPILAPQGPHVNPLNAMVNPLQQMQQNPWANSFHQQMIQPAIAPDMSPDRVVGRAVNDFKMQAILMYDYWATQGRPVQVPQAQWQALNYAFCNAVATIRWYVETLRIAYYYDFPGPTLRLTKGTLVTRSVNMSFLANVIFDVMILLQRNELFRYPFPVPFFNWGPMATPYVQGSQGGYNPFPYYVPNQPGNWSNGQVVDQYGPQNQFHGGNMNGYQPNYDMNQWNNQLNHIPSNIDPNALNGMGGMRPPMMGNGGAPQAAPNGGGALPSLPNVGLNSQQNFGGGNYGPQGGYGPIPQGYPQPSQGGGYGPAFGGFPGQR